MKTVLVVGGAGYIGSHVAQALLDAGYAAIVLDALITGHRDLVPAGAMFVEGDAGDSGFLDQCFSKYPIDSVMHFAAFSQVGESVRDPARYYENNVGKTATLLGSMARHDVRRFVFSSTAAVYAQCRLARIPEVAPLSPNNPYGSTKMAVERLLAECETAYGLQHVSFRYFNAAGADLQARRGERHQPETHLIPLVLQVASGRRESLAVFGNDYDTPDGTCLRDYVHVDDLARAHVTGLDALGSGHIARAFNLGNERGFSVLEVIEVSRSITGRHIAYRIEPRRPGDVARLVADSTAARNDLGWTPKLPAPEQIIESAWKWEQAEAARARGR